MPKRLIEINKFTGGVVSTPSATDINEQSAKYSLNIDPQTSEGRLQGVDNDKWLTSDGFASTGSKSVVGAVKEMITVSDKENPSKINLVIAKNNSTDFPLINVINTVSVVQDLYSNTTNENILETGMSSVFGEYDLKASDDKVFIGMGGSQSTNAKVVMTPSGKTISGGDKGGIGVFDAALTPPASNAFSSMFSEFMIFPIHGVSSSINLSLNDSDAGVLGVNYDVELAADLSSQTLFAYMESSTIKVGQILKLNSGHSNDFSDGALLKWKQYDYDLDASLDDDDLFMYCGAHSSGAPVLRFIGNTDQTPAFMYAIKEESSILSKISLTKTADADAFGSVSIDIVNDSLEHTHTFSRTSSRIDSIDLSNEFLWNDGYISAFSACSSPPLYNSLGLIDEDIDPHTSSSNIFYENGGLQILYRHGVFYVSNKNSRTTLYRLNAIDFYGLTNNGVALDDLTLDFSNIPDQLHAEDGKGIVRRTIEDQLLEPPEDPKNHTWSNVPANAEIIGICETFDCGKLESVEDETSTFTGKEAYKFITKNQSRLTTGDKVRFSGMTVGGDNTNFNIGTPYEVSVVNDGNAFFIDSGASTKVPSLNSTNPMWWNSKVWVLYGKKSNVASFDKWDLFLYNANTLDMTSGRSVYMADRTPPFQQARYYETDTDDGSIGKLWYPGQFAFIKKDPTPGYNGGNNDEQNYSAQGLQLGDVKAPKEYVGGTGTSENFCEFGIYDKAGRWACNGTKRQQTLGDDRPADWVGGQDGPSSRKINGSLFFGQNIGWSIEEGEHRQVKPIKNSVHPLVPYSTLYNGNLAYPGYNSTNYTEKFGKEDGKESSNENPQLKKYHNRPKHSVTFIGKVTGTFIQQPGLILRNPRDLGINAENDDMDKAFLVAPETQKLKSYNDDYTLFTIDDFSGHRGSVEYEEGNDSVSLSTYFSTDNRRPKGGVATHRPNFGGPDIENPIFKETTIHQNEREVGSHPNTNGGYSAVIGDSDDIGWDGYTVPYLFNPGSGYYVYINRSFQNMSPFSQLSPRDIQNKTTWAWGFNATSYNVGRFNNFSSTAISDNVVTNDRPTFYHSSVALILTQQAEEGISTRFYYIKEDDTNTFELTYNNMPSHAQSICTMHKINGNDIGEINSIFPMIFNSNIDTSIDDNKDFASGYICGTSRTNTNGSGALVLRTNFDYIWDKHSREFRNNIHDGRILDNVLYTNFDARYDGSGSLPYPYNRRGTHDAETINITTEATNYKANEIESMQMLQANLDTYNSTITGDKIVLAANTPFKGWAVTDNITGADCHFFLQSNARNNSNLYLGYQDDAYLRIEGTENTEDLNGSFFTADSGEIFTSTTSDNTLLTTAVGMLTFDTPAEGTSGDIVEGDYYYKLAYEYDDIYHSPLTESAILTTISPNDAGNVFEYIKINLSLPSNIVNSIPERVTGIAVYRKFEGGDDDAYSLVNIIKNTDNWIYESSNDTYNIDVYDKDNLKGTYFYYNGISETLDNTSLNYGLSAIFQGYMFVSRAFHPNLEDVKRYIFRSQPDNFFTFNWAEDFVIMPETPIAMVSFNSRLYVWGQNNLYKIDPFSMLIEDTYEGISILNKDSFVKTEYGLCFMDKNNVYIHDGNKPVSIADSILYSSNDSIVYSVATSTYDKLEQGYRELAEQTETNIGHKAHMSYSAKHNSFLIHLSDSNESGKVLAFNLRKRRWDIWDSPKPFAITSSKDSDILISDNTNLYNYTKFESEEWNTFGRRSWDWFSKDINFGADTQDKVFRSIKLSGTPTIQNFNNAFDFSDAKKNSVQAYVDDDLVLLRIKNKSYETINIGQTYLSAHSSSTIEVNTELSANNKQEFIRPGHLLKINDEIMYVSSANYTPTTTILSVQRGVMGTTEATHSTGVNTPVYSVSPVLKFPAGTKGKYLNIRLFNQKGYIDSIGVVYKPKSVK